MVASKVDVLIVIDEVSLSARR